MARLAVITDMVSTNLERIQVLVDRKPFQVVAVAAGTVSAAAAVYGLTRILLGRKRSSKYDYPFEYDKAYDGVGLKINRSAQYDTYGRTPDFDFIIVGGGTAGCVLASRLSENPRFTVLLLEAGGSALKLPESRVPTAYGQLLHSEHGYELYTEKQKFADGKEKFWPRGKMLGGCSSINAMICHYGVASDYDEWARIGGKDAEWWAYREFGRYFRKFEKYIPHPLFSIPSLVFRGFDGLMSIGHYGNFSNFSKMFISSCARLGVKEVDDLHPTENPTGVGKVMNFIDKQGRRVSTESAYLSPEVRGRKNLKILTNVRVTEIQIEPIRQQQESWGSSYLDPSGAYTISDYSWSEPSEKLAYHATGVHFGNANDRQSDRYQVSCNKEVIIAAGAIHTPHLLLLSGIGPNRSKENFRESDEPNYFSWSRFHLPGVGSHLVDHPMVTANFRVKPGESLNYLNPRFGGFMTKLKAIPAVIQWQLFGTGPLTCNVAEAAAFLRTSDPTVFPSIEYPEEIQDTASGPTAPDLEVIACPVAWSEHGYGPIPPGDLACMGAILLRPTSTGHIRLRSSDPYDEPVIDPQYLLTQHDISVLARGLKFMLKLSRQEPLASVLQPDSDPQLDNRLDPDTIPLSVLEEEVKKRVETVYHPTSTARMAPMEDGGVVDSSLKVYGIEALRICDASVFPTIPAGHTAGPVIALAEKAAEMLKADHKRVKRYAPQKRR